MILQSNKDMDMTFVSRAVQDRDLWPSPVVGFHSKPNYWQETSRWRRVVEEYEWGCVLFLNDREHDLAATVVVIGKLDLNTGKVVNKGKTQHISISWYHEMAEALKVVKPKDRTIIPVPPCLGFHESDHVCDGGNNPKTKHVEPPCGWRTRCIALLTYATEQNKAQEDLLKSKSPEQIVQFTTRLLERSGLITKPGKSPSPKKQQSATKAAKKPSGGQTAELPQIARDLFKEVAEKASVALSSEVPDTCLTWEQAGVLPGELFIIDRTARTDYISLYQAMKPRPKPLASFRVRRRIGGFVVQLPIPKDSELLSGVVDSDVKDWKDGAFQCGVGEVIPGQRRMDIISHVLVQLINPESQS